MNEKLRQDVEFLKGKRIIKRDKDIIESTGVNKTALSNYLSGRVKASKPFLDKFYEVYEAELNVNKVNKMPADTSDLAKENAELKKLLDEKQKIIDAQERIILWQEHFFKKSRKSFAQAIKLKPQ